MRISDSQIRLVNGRIEALVAADNFYGKKLKAAGISSVSTPEEFEALPFSEKSDLRDAYPLGLMTAPEEEIVRIHSSSGTTGLPVIIPYTKKDVEDWAIMFARCFEYAGPATACGPPGSASRPAASVSALWPFPWAPATPRSS